MSPAKRACFTHSPGSSCGTRRIHRLHDNSGRGGLPLLGSNVGIALAVRYSALAAGRSDSKVGVRRSPWCHPFVVGFSPHCEPAVTRCSGANCSRIVHGIECLRQATPRRALNLQSWRRFRHRASRVHLPFPRRLADVCWRRSCRRANAPSRIPRGKRYLDPTFPGLRHRCGGPAPMRRGHGGR
jgi:hypothetical protein